MLNKNDKMATAFTAVADASKKNRKIEPIKDKSVKRDSWRKRAKCIINKCRELSVLCSLDINLSMYDPCLKRLHHFCTKDDFT